MQYAGQTPQSLPIFEIVQTFGILILGEQVFVSDRGSRKIEIHDLEQPGPPRGFAAAHPHPDGMAWSPLRVTVLDEIGS